MKKDITKLLIMPLVKDIEYQDYDERRKFKIIWKSTMPHYIDFIYILYIRLTGRVNHIDPETLERLDLPKPCTNYRYSILIRVETIGYV